MAKMTFAELKIKLKDKFWRLNNLYYIKDKHGKKVKFKMTREQLEYYEGMHSRNVILKARQLGFTTEKCIMQLDTAIFENKQCAMIEFFTNGMSIDDFEHQFGHDAMAQQVIAKAKQDGQKEKANDRV